MTTPDPLIEACARALSEADGNGGCIDPSYLRRASAVLAIARPNLLEMAAQECDVVEEHGEVYDDPYFSNGAADCARRIRALAAKAEGA